MKMIALLLCSTWLHGGEIAAPVPGGPHLAALAAAPQTPHELLFAPVTPEMLSEMRASAGDQLPAFDAAVMQRAEELSAVASPSQPDAQLRAKAAALLPIYRDALPAEQRRALDERVAARLSALATQLSEGDAGKLAETAPADDAPKTFAAGLSGFAARAKGFGALAAAAARQSPHVERLAKLAQERAPGVLSGATQVATQVTTRVSAFDFAGAFKKVTTAAQTGTQQVGAIVEAAQKDGVSGAAKQAVAVGRTAIETVKRTEPVGKLIEAARDSGVTQAAEQAVALGRVAVGQVVKRTGLNAEELKGSLGELIVAVRTELPGQLGTGAQATGRAVAQIAGRFGVSEQAVLEVKGRLDRASSDFAKASAERRKDKANKALSYLERSVRVMPYRLQYNVWSLETAVNKYPSEELYALIAPRLIKIYGKESDLDYKVREAELLETIAKPREGYAPDPVQQDSVVDAFVDAAKNASEVAVYTDAVARLKRIARADAAAGRRAFVSLVQEKRKLENPARLFGVSFFKPDAKRIERLAEAIEGMESSGIGMTQADALASPPARR